MSMNKKLSEEGADWIAEMVSEDLGGFVPAELVDLIMEFEIQIRTSENDPEMGHKMMTEKLIPLLEAEGVPLKEGALTPGVIEEILFWEDEFYAMAGQTRKIRS
jgi:hypothetical protein